MRAAQCIIVAAGPKHQKLAVDYLFTIWKRLPTFSLKKLMELMDGKYGLNDESAGELVDGRIAILKQLELSNELASQFAERLEKGNSAERGLVTNYFFVQGLANPAKSLGRLPPEANAKKSCTLRACSSLTTNSLVTGSDW